MDKAQFEQEKQYGAALAIASRLLKNGLITLEEHQKLMQVLAQELHPKQSYFPL
jgi:hypothetical protein